MLHCETVKELFAYLTLLLTLRSHCHKYAIPQMCDVIYVLLSTPSCFFQLSQALLMNKLSTNTLTYLNLCGNSIKEDSQALCSFLAQVSTNLHYIFIFLEVAKHFHLPMYCEDPIIGHHISSG
jgi:hypothetical protein